ncbi:hypothetical protein MKW98_009887, partial [Papaver atlanticum]
TIISLPSIIAEEKSAQEPLQARLLGKVLLNLISRPKALSTSCYFVKVVTVRVPVVMLVHSENKWLCPTGRWWERLGSPTISARRPWRISSGTWWTTAAWDGSSATGWASAGIPRLRAAAAAARASTTSGKPW